MGVDRRPGPGVDVVDPDDSLDGAGAFDVVISSETLEHADNPAGLIASAWRALRPGGTLVLTAAGPDRTPHTCDGGPDPVGHGEYYANVSAEQLTNLLADWTDVDVRYGLSHGHAMGDVYATAKKPVQRWPFFAVSDTYGAEQEIVSVTPLDGSTATQVEVDDGDFFFTNGPTNLLIGCDGSDERCERCARIRATREALVTPMVPTDPAPTKAKTRTRKKASKA